MNTDSWGRLAKIIIVLAVLGAISLLSNLYMDWLWFKSVDFAGAFVTMLTNKMGLYAIIFLLSFLLFFINLQITRRVTKLGHDRPEETADGGDIIFLNQDKLPWKRFMGSRAAKWMTLIISIIGAYLVSSVSADSWVVVQQFINRVPFGTVDPIFHKDIGFYVFNLTFYKFVYSTLMTALILVTVTTALIYIFDATTEIFFADWRKFTFGKKPCSHIAGSNNSS